MPHISGPPLWLKEKERIAALWSTRHLTGDFVFAIGHGLTRKSVKIHKEVLISRSTTFTKDYFSDHPNNYKHLALDPRGLPEIRTALEYMYTGIYPSSHHQPTLKSDVYTHRSLLVHSVYFGLPRLQKTAAYNLIKSLPIYLSTSPVWNESLHTHTFLRQRDDKGLDSDPGPEDWYNIENILTTLYDDVYVPYHERQRDSFKRFIPLLMKHAQSIWTVQEFMDYINGNNEFKDHWWEVRDKLVREVKRMDVEGVEVEGIDEREFGMRMDKYPARLVMSDEDWKLREQIKRDKCLPRDWYWGAGT